MKNSILKYRNISYFLHFPKFYAMISVRSSRVAGWKASILHRMGVMPDETLRFQRLDGFRNVYSCIADIRFCEFEVMRSGHRNTTPKLWPSERVVSLCYLITRPTPLWAAALYSCTTISYFPAAGKFFLIRSQPSRFSLFVYLNVQGRLPTIRVEMPKPILAA